MCTGLELVYKHARCEASWKECTCIPLPEVLGQHSSLAGSGPKGVEEDYKQQNPSQLRLKEGCLGGEGSPLELAFWAAFILCSSGGCTQVLGSPHSQVNIHGLRPSIKLNFLGFSRKPGLLFLKLIVDLLDSRPKDWICAS